MGLHSFIVDLVPRQFSLRGSPGALSASFLLPVRHSLSALLDVRPLWAVGCVRLSFLLVFSIVRFI